MVDVRVDSKIYKVIRNRKLNKSNITASEFLPKLCRAQL